MTQTNKQKSVWLPILIIGALFFIFGFVTWLNGILIPYLKIACELTDFQALLVAFSFYISYTIMALPSSWVLKKTGFKNGMMVGLWVMAVGALIFIPAAMTRTYIIFLLGLFVLGTGLAVLQTASNPYITILGPEESAASRISIMGICNKVAGALAPLILAYFILSDGDAFVESLKTLSVDEKSLALDGLARRVINPYIVMAVVLFLMGVGIRFSPLPEIDMGEEEELSGDETPATIAVEKKTIFDFPHLILGVLALFFYVGAEVIAGDTIIRYGQSLGMSIGSAKFYTSLVMVGMVIGYIIGILLIPKILKQRIALIISAVLGVIFCLGVIMAPENMSVSFPFIDFTTFKSMSIHLPLSVLFVALFGISNALVWPAVWPLAIHGLGKFIKTGSALLIMAISGGALLPLVWGRLSDSYNSTFAYIIMIPCYLVILYFAVHGYKIKSWKRK